VTGFPTAGGAGDRRAHAAGRHRGPEYVVNCAGMWARQLGELAGVSIPLQAAEHYYLLTEPIEEVGRRAGRYWRIPPTTGITGKRGGGLMLGLFEPVCAPWEGRRSPRGLLLRRAAPGLGPDGSLPGARHVPGPGVGAGRDQEVLLRPGKLHTDLLPIVGEAPELRNYFVAAGMNSIGILTGGGIGRVIAHWIAGRPAGRRRDGHEHRPAAPLPGQS